MAQPKVRAYISEHFIPVKVDFDNDKDGVPDSIDICKNSKETPNGYKDDDGCPDEVPPNGDNETSAINDNTKSTTTKPSPSKKETDTKNKSPDAQQQLRKKEASAEKTPIKEVPSNPKK